MILTQNTKYFVLCGTRTLHVLNRLKFLMQNTPEEIFFRRIYRRFFSVYRPPPGIKLRKSRDTVNVRNSEAAALPNGEFGSFLTISSSKA